MVISVSPRILRPGQNIHILNSPEEYEYLKCKLCGELLTNPVQTCPTGHRESCFRISVINRERCPACVEEGVRPEDDCILMGGSFTDKGAKYDIDKLKVQCMICGYQSTIKEMKSHEHIVDRE